MTRRTGQELDCDVLVAGAGPAGLFTALGIAAASELRVLVIDQGPLASDRQRAATRASTTDHVQGVGGAGLFSDGKLCMSLDVGGHLKAALDNARKESLLQSIQDVFGALGQARSPTPSMVGGTEAAIQAAREVGLNFKYYPVLHIGTDRCREVIIRLCEALERRGVQILSGTRLTGIKTEPGRPITATIIRGGTPTTITTSRLVLAMGKVGASLQADLCRHAGIRVASQPMYIGLRFETSAEALQPLFRLSKDPKFSMLLGDGSKIKTHCASEGGELLELRYDGLPLVGGHNFSSARSGRSGFAILWDGLRRSTDAYSLARQLMGQVAEHTHARLLAQTLRDYRAGQATTPETLASVPLSYRGCAAGNVRDFLPSEYFAALDAFLERLVRLAPDILEDDSVLVAPAIEWWMNAIAVQDTSMETSVPGLYVCGDGSGWSQGIVHAAATGLLVAEGITGRALSEMGENLRDAVADGVGA